MIPVETISSTTMGNLLYYVAIIGLLLVVATFIRLKVSFLRKAFIPASLLAGLMGLALGPYFLNVIPSEMMSSIGTIPSHMITVVFACMLLGMKKQDGKALGHNALAGGAWLYAASFLQVGVVCILCVVLFTPFFGVDPLFGSVFEIGFAGGHGTAGGMVEVFTELGWADGGDVGKTTATIGLLAGIFGGIAIINYGVRKRYTKVLTESTSGAESVEVYPEGQREAAAYATVSQDVVEPFALHLGVIGMAILLGRAIVYAVSVAFNYSLPLFPFAMIGGWIINGIIQRTSLRDMFDRGIFQRIQGMALEILVVGAIASVSVPVVMAYFVPLLIGSAVVIGMMVAMFFFICPYIYTDNWFEHSIIRFGAFCGVAAVGYMLLRTADPKMETDAGTVYALATPFMSPFIGGGLITTAYPYMIAQFGALGAGLGLCVAGIAILVVLRFTLWNKNAKLVQR